MWPRLILGTALLCTSCSGNAPPPPSDPPPMPSEAAPAEPVETSPPVDVAPEPEPPPEPTTAETAEPPPSRPTLPPLPKCEELEQSRCEITEGCEWHSKKGCLEQEKPKTLDPDS